MAFALSSAAFSDGAKIPTRYTGDGENVSPALWWVDPPSGTQSYVVLVEDPDAPSGTFRHWAAYDIPANRIGLPEGAGSGNGPDGIRHAVNDFGHASYDGSAPPKGHGPHHYHFRVAALNTPHLDVPPSAKVADVWRAAQQFILAESEIVGVYAR